MGWKCVLMDAGKAFVTQKREFSSKGFASRFVSRIPKGFTNEWNASNQYNWPYPETVSFVKKDIILNL